MSTQKTPAPLVAGQGYLTVTTQKLNPAPTYQGNPAPRFQAQ